MLRRVGCQAGGLYNLVMQTSLAQKLAGYRPDSQAINLIKTTPILLLVGPTGAGKGALKQKLFKTGRFHDIVSHTTRPPRSNHGVPEKNGVDYHFVDKSVAEQMLDRREFVEAKIYSGNLYGTSVAEISQAHAEGKVALADIEVQGVAEYKALDPSVMAVFLLPPDFETWQQRLQKRYGAEHNSHDHNLRLQTALDEIKELLSTDYYAAVINDDLEQTYEQIKAIIDAPDHAPQGQPAARAIAQKLADDIRRYLSDRTG